MRVLHLVTSVSEKLGGVSESVIRLCSGLNEIGCKVELLAYDTGRHSPALDRAVANGVRLMLLKRPHSFVVPDLALRNKLSAIVREYDIVHIHGMWQYLNWCAASFCAKAGIPYVCMPHGCLSPWSLQKSKFRKMIVAALLDRRLMKHAKRIVVTSCADVQNARLFGLDVPCSVVKLGVDIPENNEVINRTELCERLGLDPRKRILLFLSRIAEGKGLDILSEAWKRLRQYHGEWQLILAGPSSRGGKVAEETFSKSCDEGTYKFIGPVYGVDKASLLSAAELFVLPSKSENFSLSIAEALSSGVPVVCTKGTPWKDIDGVCGWWTDVSVEGVYAALNVACGMPKEQLVQLGKNAVEFVRERFSWDRSAKELKSVYEAVLSECGGGR